MTPTSGALRAARSTRVVHLAPGHVPFDTRVFHKEARTLAAAGYEVTVIAPTDTPTTVDGVTVLGLPRSCSRFDRFVRGPFRLLRAARRVDGDVYHLHDFEALPVGMLLAALGHTVVLDAHEDYPRLARDRAWIPAPLRGLVAGAVRVLERVAVTTFVAVISAEAEGAKRFPAAKTTLIRNYPLAEEFPEASTPVDRRANVAVYLGDLSRHRGVVEMVDAMARLPRSLDACLLLGGRTREGELMDDLQSTAGWSRTSWLGYLDRTSVRAALEEARLGLLLLHPTRKYVQGAVPVKLYEYMAAGIPVVASDFPVIREIVSAADAGILVDPLDADQVVSAMATLFADPTLAAKLGANGRRFVLEHCTWEREAEQLLALYRQVSR